MRTIKLFFFLAPAFFVCANLHAQVTIGGLNEPQKGAILDLNSDVKGGLVLSNVKLLLLYEIPYDATHFPGLNAGNYEAKKSEFTGAIVYHTGENGIPAGAYVWNGTNWSSVGEDCRPLTSVSLTASNPFPKPGDEVTFTASSDAGGNCSDEVSYSWSISGSNSPTLSATSGTTVSATFTNIGSCTVTVTANNRYTPLNSVTNTVDISVSSDGGVPVDKRVSGFYLTGKPCYDVNQNTDNENGRTVAVNAPARVATSIDFTNSVNRTRTYNFYHATGYSNLSITLLENENNVVANLIAPAASDVNSGNKTIQLVFDPDVENKAVSATDHSLSVTLLASYIPQGETAVKYAVMNISVQDLLCGCPAKINASEWLTFACHNLGGKDIFSYVEGNVNGTGQPLSRDYHGDSYKWGASTAALQNTVANDSYNNSTGWNNLPYQAGNTGDWNPANNPCPAGWRVFNRTEADGIYAYNPGYNTLSSIPDLADSWLTEETNTVFGNIKQIGDYLYLPAAGYREHDSNGNMRYRGHYGCYWTSTGHTNGHAYGYPFGYEPIGGELYVTGFNRSTGFSVRCVVAE
jgi:hypothetical protein